MRKTVSTIALSCALAAGVLAAAPATAQEAGPARPNILLIIADDVGLDVTPGLYPGLADRLLELYGPRGHDHPEYREIDGKPASMPVLDRFASEGMVFTDAWAQPYCSPTRASLLTGLFASNTDVLTYADALSQDHDSFVRTLGTRGGFSTAVFGKWHMAGLPGKPRDYPGMKPKEAGFELFRGNMHAALPSFWQYPEHIQDDQTPPGEWRTEDPRARSLSGIAPTTYAPVVKAADTIDWIRERERADPDKPWFAWLAFNLSHATAAQRQGSQMIVPNADTLDETTRREMEECGGTFGTNQVGSCSGEALMRAMTNSMDTIIGRILDAVDQLDPNTYVIFVSDNGTPMYGRPQLDFIDNLYITRSGRGKGTPFESGARVALAIRGPGIEAGSASNEFVHVADLFPTILEMAGLPVPETVAGGDGRSAVPLDGVSLMPILSGREESVRDPRRGFILTESVDLLKDSRKVVGARNARFKLVCTDSADNCAFYDLQSDPLEEYPLEAPASCEEATAARSRDDPAWDYCHLAGIVASRSILKEST
jgi:arylsulfatase A-like enzyme